VQIVTGTPGALTQINIETQKPLTVASPRQSELREQTVPGARAVATLFDTAHAAASSESKSKTTFTGLIFIDGARATDAEMKSLDAKQIESVEVLKGVAAEQLYGPGAANGVITIKTKRVK
jgi:Outer membrane receptor for ferrienterochelin and colicins